MYGECTSLPIPEAVPDALRAKARQEKKFLRTITVRFSAGNHPNKLREIDTDDDMYIVLNPLADKSGQKGVCLKPPGSFSSWFDNPGGQEIRGQENTES